MKAVRLMRRVLAGSFATLLTASVVFMTPHAAPGAATGKVQEDSNTLTYQAILGEAAKYGVVAETYNKKSHTETSFAAKVYIGNDNDDIDLATIKSSYIMIGEYGDYTDYDGKTGKSKLVLGKTTAGLEKVEVEAPKEVLDNIELHAPFINNGTKLVKIENSKEAVDSKIDDMLSSVKRTSSQLNSKSNDKDYKVDVDSVLKEKTLDLTDDKFKGDERVASQSHHRTYRECNVAETEQDVEEDGDKGDDDRNDSAIGDVLSHRRSYLLRRNDGTAFAHIRILERLHAGLADEAVLLQCVIENGLTLVVGCGRVRLNLIVRRDTDGLTVGTEGNGRSVAFGISLSNDRTDFLRLHTLLECHHVVTTTSEVDALAESANGKADAEDDSSNSHGYEGLLVERHERNLHVLHQVLRQRSGEGESEPLVVLVTVLVDDTGQEHSGEERAEDTDDPSGGEALHRTCTEIEQDDTGDDTRQVRVEDSAECVAVTGLQGILDVLAVTHLFLDTLIDKHVGIHGRTKRKHDTGKSRHGQSGLERGKNTEREEQVHDKGAVGHHTWDETVHGHHVDHQQDEGDDERPDTLLD